MKIPLDVETYKGVDGSSLSSTRCFQIVRVYDMLEKFGNEEISFWAFRSWLKARCFLAQLLPKVQFAHFSLFSRNLILLNMMGLFPLINVSQSWELNL